MIEFFVGMLIGAVLMALAICILKSGSDR